MSSNVTKVPFINFHKLNNIYEDRFQSVLSGMIARSWYILGQNVADFEKEYAAFNQTKFCVGLANGLDALILSLKALGIGKGDEVIVPSNTYIASWLAITHVGATVVPVEPRENTCNINPDLIAAKINGQTKAVMPVNLYGQACELTAIKKICDDNNLFLVEDNAQAQGATCDGSIAGSFGIINGTSFYPGKNIGALGDAGAITTDDADLAKKIQTLRNYGSQLKYYNETIGYNSRLDELQAGFLSIKLKDLSSANQHRQEAASWYKERLQDIAEITVPDLAEGCTSVNHIYQIRTERRAELQAYLTTKKIGTMIHYPVPPHLQQAYLHLGYKKGDFPIAEKIAETTLSLPIDPFIQPEEVSYVCDAIESFFR